MVGSYTVDQGLIPGSSQFRQESGIGQEIASSAIVLFFRNLRKCSNEQRMIALSTSLFRSPADNLTHCTETKQLRPLNNRQCRFDNGFNVVQFEFGRWLVTAAASRPRARRSTDIRIECSAFYTLLRRLAVYIYGYNHEQR